MEDSENRSSPVQTVVTLKKPFQLGEWQVLPDLNRLRRDSEEIQIEPKAMGVLLCLAETPREVVQRNDLLTRVWEKRFVTDYVLSRCISSLRKVFGDDPSQPRYIETVRKGGYRLLEIPRVLPEAKPKGVVEKASPQPVEANRPSNNVWWFVVGLISTIGFWVIWQQSQRQPTESLIERPVTSTLGSEVDPALSPDGTQVVFAWDSQAEDDFNLHLKWLDANDTRQLTFQDGEEKNPVWSPDGRWIAYVYAGLEEKGIYKVSALGGEPQLVVPTLSGNIPDLAWSADGRYFYFPDRPSSEEPFSIFRYDLQRAEKMRVTHPPKHFYGDRDLALAPDGSYLVSARASIPGRETLWLHDLAEGTSTCLDERVRGILGMALLPKRNGLIFGLQDKYGTRLKFNKLIPGEPETWLDLGNNGNDPALIPSGHRLVYERKKLQADIWQVRQEGGDWQQPVRAVSSTMWDYISCVTSDGKMLGFVSNRTGENGIWVASIEGGSQPRSVVKFQSRQATTPIFSVDGTSLIYGDVFEGAMDLLRVSVSGGQPERLLQLPGREQACSWSNSGDILYFGSDRSGGWQIWSYELASGKIAQVTTDGGIHAKTSDDGRWIFYSRPKQPGLWRMPIGGGASEKLLDDLAPGYRRDWDLMGQGVVYLTETLFANQRKSVMFHHFSTGESYSLTDPIPTLSYGNMGLVAAPNQSSFYFSRFDRIESDLWVTDAKTLDAFANSGRPETENE